ncbi:retrovirus-related Pol polyprotein from transposon 17.6, partial [Trichonephila inaurata madagascariensis]
IMLHRLIFLEQMDK